MAKRRLLELQCLECGRRIKVKGNKPSYRCPRCGSYDMDIADVEWMKKVDKEGEKIKAKENDRFEKQKPVMVMEGLI